MVSTPLCARNSCGEPICAADDCPHHRTNPTLTSVRINRTRYPLRTIVRWLWLHQRGCRLQAAVNVLCGLALVALSLCGVEALRLLTDVAAGARPGSLLQWGLLLGGVMVAELLLHILMTWVQAVLGVRSQNRLQQHFFARILQSRWQGVERFHSGDVLNRLFSDVADIVNLLTEVLPFAVVTLTQFIASLVYLFIMDAQLAWILLIVSPLFAVLSRFYFRRMRRIVRKIKDSNSALQSIIQETVQHRMVVKVMERTGDMVDRLERRQQLLRWQVKCRARFSIFAKTMVNIGFAGGYLAALLWGLCQLQDGLITVGVLLAFTQLIHRIQRPLIDLMRLLPTLVGSFTASERLMELEELPLECAPEPVALQGQVGVRFEDVDFSYTEPAQRPHHDPDAPPQHPETSIGSSLTSAGPRPILRGFTFDFRPGTTTAILGPTGAGKTTLIRLMLALIEPSRGSVRIYDETGTDSPPTPGTRRAFSYVPQGNTLFSGTIRDNLRLGHSAATDAQMYEALDIAQASFVSQLPKQLDTPCGEGGGGLSEGQAQRIAIARALLRPCSVLLLDEATSALDIDTENSLLQAIRTHYPHTTILFITHRLTTVHFADQQVTLQRHD